MIEKLKELLSQTDSDFKKRPKLEQSLKKELQKEKSIKWGIENSNTNCEIEIEQVDDKTYEFVVQIYYPDAGKDKYEGVAKYEEDLGEWEIEKEITIDKSFSKLN